jgi:hypothetical protein
MSNGPFKIKCEIFQSGSVKRYKHTLWLYNSQIGFKVGPSPIAPEWMRQRQAVGNTSHILDGTYQPPKPDAPIKGVLRAT